MKSDADIIRDAKLEAMGLPPAEDNEPHRGNRRPQMATDEMVRILRSPSFLRLRLSFTDRSWSDSRNGCASSPSHPSVRIPSSRLFTLLPTASFCAVQNVFSVLCNTFNCYSGMYDYYYS